MHGHSAGSRLFARDLDQVADAAVRAMGEVGAAMVYRGDEDFAALDRTAHRWVAI